MNNANEKVIYKELSYKITGLLFKIHKALDRYRNEKQYADFFEELLKQEGIKYIREYRFEDFQYGKGKVRCVCDFIVDDKIILEFKTKNYLSKEDYFQTKRYLVTLNLKLAILVNFRQPSLVPKRILNNGYCKLA
ncbi:GxxExxY protein [Patescibacteria group bacterium]|nr:GxxExxY protein [Patescibacteria group bacterium]